MHRLSVPVSYPFPFSPIPFPASVKGLGAVCNPGPQFLRAPVSQQLIPSVMSVWCVCQNVERVPTCVLSKSSLQLNGQGCLCLIDSTKCPFFVNVTVCVCVCVK